MKKYGCTFSWTLIYSLLFSLISCSLNGLSWKQFIFLLSYQMFIYFLPGVAIVLLLKIPAKTDVQWIGYSFLAGYIFNIVLYFAIVPLHAQEFVKGIGAILSAVAVSIIYLKRKMLECTHDKTGMRLCTVGTLILTLLMFVCYNATGLSPKLTGATDYYEYHRDVLYWIGNLNSLMKQYPPINPREYMAGTLNYHYFSSLQLAVQCLFTEISSVVVCLGTYFHASTVLMIYGTYLFANAVVKNKWVIKIAFVALLFTTGVENITKVSWVAHFIQSALGTDYAMGIFCFFLIVLFNYCEDKGSNCNLKYDAVLAGLIAVIVGTKGPYGAIALCGIGVICIIHLLDGKILKSVVLGATSLATFGLTYYYICNTKGYGSGNSDVSLYNVYIQTEEGMSFKKACLMKAIIEARDFLLMKPAVILPLVIAVILSVCCKKKFTDFEKSCLFMAIVGFAFNAIITMPSNQQLYFALASMVPAWTLVLSLVGRNYDIILSRWKKWMNAGIILIVSVGMICFPMGQTAKHDRLIRATGVAAQAIRCRYLHETMLVKSDKYDVDDYVLDRDTYEALDELYCNEDMDSVILYHVPEAREKYESYGKKLVGSFSGKYIMVDDKLYSDIQHSRMDKCKVEDMKQKNIDYIVVDFWQEENDLPKSMVQAVYCGKRIAIYRMVSNMNEDQ